MRTCCRTFLAFSLKFLNFLQTFLGICMIIYSIYMLNQWNHHIPINPPPPSSAPSPAFSSTLFLPSNNFLVSEFFDDSDIALVSGFYDGIGLQFAKLPAPWFIYSFMTMGIVLCCITCIGHIAAEAINGCFLCFYTLLATVIILLEAAFVAFLAFDHQWEKDLPIDPTGELDSFRSFIEDNIDICKWVGISIVTIQALSLFLALILRSMVSTRIRDWENDSDVERRIREPMLNHQSSPTSGSNKDSRGTYSDIWSSRIREKYGLNSVEAKYSSLNQDGSTSMRSK